MTNPNFRAKLYFKLLTKFIFILQIKYKLFWDLLNNFHPLLDNIHEKSYSKKFRVKCSFKILILSK